MFPEVEAPFGGIGTAAEIFERIYARKLQTVGILISPPSSIELHGMTMIWLKKIFDAGIQLNVVLAISVSKEKIFDWTECVGLRDYFTETKRITHAYSLFGSQQMKRVKLSGEWREYYHYAC